MIKKSLLAVAVTLATASAPSFAAYISTIPSLTGEVEVTGFADGTPNTFSMQLRDMNGTMNLQIPPSNNYQVQALSGNVVIDYNSLTPDINIPAPAAPGIVFTGLLSLFGITPGNYPLAFLPGANDVNDGTGQNIGFSINYDGQTTPAVLGLLSALTGLTFLPSQVNGTGTLGVTGQLFADGAFLTFTDTPTGWLGFGPLLTAADNFFDPLQGTPNAATGTFTLTDVTIKAVPEPASLALLGLGLAGLGMMRRRKA